MIAWIKRLFGIGAVANHVSPSELRYVEQRNNKAGGDIVGRDLVVISGKADAGRSIVAEAVGNEVVLRVQAPPKRSKKQKKLSREARRKAKAASRG